MSYFLHLGCEHALNIKCFMYSSSSLHNLIYFFSSSLNIRLQLIDIAILHLFHVRAVRHAHCLMSVLPLMYYTLKCSMLANICLISCFDMAITRMLACYFSLPILFLHLLNHLHWLLSLRLLPPNDKILWLQIMGPLIYCVNCALLMGPCLFWRKYCQEELQM